MNKDTMLGIVRHILTAAGGVLVTKGTVEAGEVEIIAGSVVALIGVVWSIVNKRNKPTA